MEIVGSILKFILELPGIKGLASKLSKKKKVNRIKQHSLFVYTQTKKLDISYMDIAPDDIGKTMVFRDLLTIILNVIDTDFKKGIVSSVENPPEDPTSHYSELFMNIVEEYNRQFKERNIPDLVINKFNQWDKSRIDMIMDQINEITKGFDVFSDHYNKTVSIVVIANMHVFAVMRDAERTLKYINGDLQDLPPYLGKYEFKKH